jgi:hypothetical protein
MTKPIKYLLSLDCLDSDGAHYESDGDDEPYSLITSREHFEQMGRPGHVEVTIVPGWDAVDR